VEVMVVNPRAIKDFTRACMQRAKTDAVDAGGILAPRRDDGRHAEGRLEQVCRLSSRYPRRRLRRWMHSNQRADDVQVSRPAVSAPRDIAPGDAEPERLHGLRRVRHRFGWRTGESCARSCELGLFAAVGKNAVMTNAHETGWQHMQQEAADELADRQRHDLRRLPWA
jgi:hypothetical protein